LGRINNSPIGSSAPGNQRQRLVRLFAQGKIRKDDFETVKAGVGTELAQVDAELPTAGIAGDELSGLLGEDAGGGELEQIQLLLGHASVQTTERYLGTKQDLVHRPRNH
jgi:hypothetical protein